MESIASARDLGLCVAITKSLEHLLATETPAPIVLSLLWMGIYGVRLSLLRGDGVPRSLRWYAGPVLDFWEACVLPNCPAVLARFLHAGNFRPSELFRDFNYLRRRCGQRIVHVKCAVHRVVAGRRHFVGDPDHTMSFSDYLDVVESYESKVSNARTLARPAHCELRANDCQTHHGQTRSGLLLVEGVKLLIQNGHCVQVCWRQRVSRCGRWKASPTKVAPVCPPSCTSRRGCHPRLPAVKCPKGDGHTVDGVSAWARMVRTSTQP